MRKNTHFPLLLLDQNHLSSVLLGTLPADISVLKNFLSFIVGVGSGV